MKTSQQFLTGANQSDRVTAKESVPHVMEMKLLLPPTNVHLHDELMKFVRCVVFRSRCGSVSVVFRCICCICVGKKLFFPAHKTSGFSAPVTSPPPPPPPRCCGNRQTKPKSHHTCFRTAVIQINICASVSHLFLFPNFCVIRRHVFRPLPRPRFTHFYRAFHAAPLLSSPSLHPLSSILPFPLSSG